MIKSLDQKIIFTGDIHNMTMNGGDQLLLRKFDKENSEVKLCKKFLKILNKYNFKPILFFTGKAIIEEEEYIRYLLKNFDFYLGGHTYNAYKPKLFYRSCYRLFGTYYPLKYLQDIDIKKTKHIIKKKLGININSWRNHAYFNDKNTNNLLTKNNFKLVSNLVDLKINKPFYENNLTILPINTYPDHEFLSHSTDHSSDWSLFKWYDLNYKIVKNILHNNGTATLLTHPLCLYLEDKYCSFENFVSSLKKLINK